MITEHSVIILAAGEGKRMRSALPKMLHPLLGRTVLGHVLAATEALRAQSTVVVVGHGADQVTDHLAHIGARSHRGAAGPAAWHRSRGAGGHGGGRVAAAARSSS